MVQFNLVTLVPLSCPSLPVHVARPQRANVSRGMRPDESRADGLRRSVGAVGRKSEFPFRGRRIVADWCGSIQVGRRFCRHVRWSCTDTVEDAGCVFE